MAKRTITKFMRRYDLAKDLTGKTVINTRKTLRAPEPRQPFQIDCGSAGVHTIMCAPGQMINPNKTCKRLGGIYQPAQQKETK